jgi:hypothetical protein
MKRFTIDLQTKSIFLVLMGGGPQNSTLMDASESPDVFSDVPSDSTGWVTLTLRRTTEGKTVLVNPDKPGTQPNTVTIVGRIVHQPGEEGAVTTCEGDNGGEIKTSPAPPSTPTTPELPQPQPSQLFRNQPSSVVPMCTSEWRIQMFNKCFPRNTCFAHCYPGPNQDLGAPPPQSMGHPAVQAVHQTFNEMNSTGSNGLP